MEEKQLAINELNNTDYSLVVVKNSKVEYRSKEESVGSIVNLLENRPELLKNAVVADKLIGRAVAMVCDFASVNYCYGQIVSKGAVDVFENNVAVNAGADIIMLDNFTTKQVLEAVEFTRQRAKLEVSGNITDTRISELKTTGVDFISTGAITKNIHAIDLSLRIIK